MDTVRVLAVFVATALAEIVGCYLPYLWFQQGRSVGWLVPAAVSLALFVALLMRHPSAAGRVYAAYGGIYIATALVWLWLVDGVTPTSTDILGAVVCLIGAGIIVQGGRLAG